MPHRVIVLNPDDFVLTPEAAAFESLPASMPVVEDIYSITSDRSAWFVVYTNPNKEAVVAKNLADMEVEAFCPRTVEWKPRTRAERDQKKPLEPVERPLLPRYLFARLPAAERAFGLIQAVDGVKEILGNGEHKIPIPGPAIDLLREREEAGDFNKTVKRGRVVAPKWAVPGLTLRIKEGPFAGFHATIQRCLPKDVVETIVAIFGRGSKVLLELDQLEKPC